MASEVEIANLALSHLGDEATVASLDPPEGSVQAERCARFYPIARDTLQEMHLWNFNSRRKTLATLVNPWTEWAYCYAYPADTLRLIAVHPPEAPADYQVSVGELGVSAEIAQPYVAETLDDGSQVIFTNQPLAVLRYSVRITDTTKFPPLFVQALAHHLASMLAGPILKGDVGAAESQRQAQMAEIYARRAMTVDSTQRRVRVQAVPAWIAGR